jgi:hypothetical protein
MIVHVSGQASTPVCSPLNICWRRGIRDLLRHCTWTACFVVDEDAYIARHLVDNQTKTEGTLHLPVCSVRQLALRADLLRCPLKSGCKFDINILKGRLCGGVRLPRHAVTSHSSTLPVCKQVVWFQIVGLQHIVWEAIVKTPSVQDGQQD